LQITENFKFVRHPEPASPCGEADEVSATAKRRRFALQITENFKFVRHPERSVEM
jgi:hypothetical protein